MLASSDADLTVLPDVDAKELRERLGSKKGFVWVKRQVTAKLNSFDTNFVWPISKE